MFKSKKGFTLIELLVVIAIIGILASVVLASLNSARKKSRDARRVSDIKQIQLALELYFDANRSYPTGLYGATATDGLTFGGYMPTVSYDPLGTSIQYTYAYSPATSPIYYHLGASLEESTNPALNSDKDCNSSSTTCPAGVAYTGGFNGGTGTPEGVQKCAAAQSGSYCYDLVP